MSVETPKKKLISVLLYWDDAPESIEFNVYLFTAYVDKIPAGGELDKLEGNDFRRILGLPDKEVSRCEWHVVKNGLSQEQIEALSVPHIELITDRWLVDDVQIDQKPVKLMLDVNVVSAIQIWYSKGIHAGEFAMSLLRGDHQEALERAHELLKPHFKDHVKYVESLPIEGRGENMNAFNGGIELDQYHQ